MSRPNLVRADTLDLQDHDTPSAQDHRHQPAHPAPLGQGPPAPHQNASLRHAQEDRAAEQDYLADQWGSGRSSHEGSELLEEDPDIFSDHGHTNGDEHATHQVGRSSEDSDMTDADEDNGDDDMVDKISSSPSIDDGKLDLPSTPSPFPSSSSPSPVGWLHHLQGRRSDIDQAFKDLRHYGVGLGDGYSGPYEILDRTAIPPIRYPHEGRVRTRKNDRQNTRESEHSTKQRRKKKKRLDNAPHVDVKRPGVFAWLDDLAPLEFHEFEPEPLSGDNPIEKDDATLPQLDTQWEYVTKDSSVESLQDPEDIDFEFVYALHTFVATVEGQANASKGDTMQLLDDSNSYWWLVRVVKDSSIGYLPAEHIETPTERLARLNKHRNADLSREHLGDSEAKPKNMIKQALKRRNQKMVQFTTPTYYDPMDIDWSEDEEHEGEDFDLGVRENRAPHQGDEHEPTTAHEKAVLAQQQQENAAQLAVQNAAPNATVSVSEMNPTPELDRSNEDLLERSDSTSKRSRNGTLRNTDSFFKDDTAEPKKLSLTPSLLRDSDQSSVTSPRSSDSKDKVTSPSSDVFENLDKTSPTTDKFKDDKKKKKEKSGMLSGLFKRKEKKIKVDEAAGGTVRTSQSDLEGMIASAASSSPTESSMTSPKELSPQTSRRPSKLTKNPPSSIQAAMSSGATTPSNASGLSSPPNGPSRGPQTASITSVPTSTPAPAQRGIIEEINAPTGHQPLRLQTSRDVDKFHDPSQQPSPAKDEQEKKESGIRSPLSGLMRDPNEPKKEKLKKATQRMDLDVDSSPERETTPLGNYRNAAHTPPPRPAPAAPRQEASNPPQISPIDKPAQERLAPMLDMSKVAHSESPISPSTPTESTQSLHTPETTSDEPKLSTAATSTTPDSKAYVEPEPEPEPEWSDAALHRYLEHDSANDIRDLLLIVHDKNDVKPVSNDHPIMKQLNFEQYEKQLDSMQTQLDGLMMDFLARKAAKRKKAATM